MPKITITGKPRESTYNIPLRAKVGRSMLLAANFVKCPFVLCVVETWVVAVERRAVLVLIFNYLTFC